LVPVDVMLATAAIGCDGEVVMFEYGSTWHNSTAVDLVASIRMRADAPAGLETVAGSDTIMMPTDIPAIQWISEQVVRAESRRHNVEDR